MSAKFDTNGEALKRTTNVIAGTSDYSFNVWFKVIGTSTPVILYYGDDPASFFDTYLNAWITNVAGTLKLNVVISLNSAPATYALQTILPDTWYNFGYRHSGNTHTVYLNGVSLGNTTQNWTTSAQPVDNLWLGDDGSGTNTSLEVSMFREWASAATANELKLEANCPVVQKATPWTNTPLTADGNDISGNAHNWTAVGSVSYVVDEVPYPTNYLASVATVVNPVGEVIVQACQPTGCAYVFTVWFKYTAPANIDMLGIFPSGASATYRPSNFNFSPDSITSYVDGWADARDLPVQIPVAVGIDYYVRIEPGLSSPTTGALTITFTPHTIQSIPVGSISINDFIEGFPLAVISAVDGDDNNVLAYIHNFKPSDGGDILADGKIAIPSSEVGDETNIYIYDSTADYALVATVPFGGIAFTRIRTCIGTQRWWAARISGGAVRARYIDPDGTLGTEHICTGIATAQRIAANNDETILYTARNDSGTGQPIKRWDLVNDVLLSDLVAAPGTYKCTELLVLGDGSILALWYNDGATHDLVMYRYDATGAVLNTYNYGTNQHDYGTLNAFARAAYALDDPDSFWVMQHILVPFGIARFVNTRVSDGVALATIDYMNFENGTYADSTVLPPSPPISLLGVSNSCPFWVANSGNVPPVETARLTVGKVTDPFDGTQEFVFDIDNGATPAEFTLLSDEEQVFEDIAPGTYAVVERPTLPNPNWRPTYLVSNDDLNDNLHVVIAPGDDVVVMVVNSLRKGKDGIYIYPPNPTEPPSGSPPDRNPHDTTLDGDGVEEESPIPNPFIVTGFLRDNS